MAPPASTGDSTRSYFWEDLAQRVRIEWLAVTLVLSALTVVLGLVGHAVGLARLDHTFYDKLLATATGQPANPDIVIVAIDDASIKQIGYWPWRRKVHAALLGRLRQARAVGLDIAFTDPNPAYPDDDQALARAIAQQGHVVLPLLIGPHGRAIHPIAPLDTAARALGYINITPDSDGVIRAVRLERKQGGKAAEHFVPALLAAAGQTALATRIAHRLGTSSVLIPYTGPPGHFTMYPYTAVLNGQVPPSAFKDKLVLVGAWGTGLGDMFATPVTRHGRPMAGVEILANILQGALADSWIHTPAPWLAALLGALPVLILCLLFRQFSPSQCFAAAVIAAALVFVAAALLLHFANIWIAPTASLIGIILAGPAWSWRTQQASLRHLDHELLALAHDDEHITLPAHSTVHWLRDRSLAARVITLHNAIDQIRHLRRQEARAQKQRDETLRFLSHDMRSPQNSILALTSLQAKPDAGLPEPELLRRIEHYAGKTLSLVDGFLLLARAESMPMHPRLINLADIVDQVRDDYWALAREHRIAMRVDHAAAAALVQGDETTLVRAISNLVDNAIKYSGADTRITFTLARRESFWQIRLSDQGRGIDASHLAGIFTPFSRVGENAADNPAGSGLGLAFVKTVIERHNGTISASSTPGAGTTFTIELPASGDDEP
jgi:signal transduction histidine kinase